MVMAMTTDASSGYGVCKVITRLMACIEYDLAHVVASHFNMRRKSELGGWR
jgi:hypothetical protein